jgi:hypothetical protein
VYIYIFCGVEKIAQKGGGVMKKKNLPTVPRFLSPKMYMEGECDISLAPNVPNEAAYTHSYNVKSSVEYDIRKHIVRGGGLVEKPLEMDSFAKGYYRRLYEEAYASMPEVRTVCTVLTRKYTVTQGGGVVPYIEACGCTYTLAKSSAAKNMYISACYKAWKKIRVIKTKDPFLCVECANDYYSVPSEFTRGVHGDSEKKDSLREQMLFCGYRGAITDDGFVLRKNLLHAPEDNYDMFVVQIAQKVDAISSPCGTVNMKT